MYAPKIVRGVATTCAGVWFALCVVGAASLLLWYQQDCVGPVCPTTDPLPPFNHTQDMWLVFSNVAIAGPGLWAPLAHHYQGRGSHPSVAWESVFLVGAAASSTVMHACHSWGWCGGVDLHVWTNIDVVVSYTALASILIFVSNYVAPARKHALYALRRFHVSAYYCIDWGKIILQACALIITTLTVVINGRSVLHILLISIGSALVLAVANGIFLGVTSGRAPTVVWEFFWPGARTDQATDKIDMVSGIAALAFLAAAVVCFFVGTTPAAYTVLHPWWHIGIALAAGFAMNVHA